MILYFIFAFYNEYNFENYLLYIIQYLLQKEGYKSYEDLVKTQIKFYLVDYTIVLFIILLIFEIKLENYIYS